MYTSEALFTLVRLFYSDPRLHCHFHCVSETIFVHSTQPENARHMTIHAGTTKSMKLLSVFNLKRRCAEWSVYDITVPREP